MDTASGDLDTLAAALGADNLWGKSRVNPADMKNNCVSVSTARLEGYCTVEDFWQATLGYPLPDRPLDYIEIVSLLARTGRRYIWKLYQWGGAKSAYENLVVDPPTYPARTNQYYRKEVLGLLIYTRLATPGRQETGHCINFCCFHGYRRLDGTDVPCRVMLRDFQADDKGEADHTDIQQAVRIYAVYDEEPRRLNLFPGAQGITDLEKREKELMERGIIPLSAWAGLNLVSEPPPATSKQPQALYTL